ncbi:MAG: terminase small subunit [Candidatus Omnitrophica bacterium]|nr:terminase small subunit [Candidatus Omnitrophota bacterium]
MAKKYNYTKKTGKPRQYSDAEQMQKKIDEYFTSCFSPKIDKLGNIIHDKNGNEILEQTRPFTMSGLAYALDLSRVGLLNYSKRPEFISTIMRARQRCEIYAEERLFDKDGCQGAKFSLINNYENWKDKTDIEHSMSDSTVEKFANLSVTELLTKANALIGKSQLKQRG